MIARPSRGTGSSGPARRRTAARIAALACAPAILLALPGCSFSTGSDKLDIDKLEREVAKGIKDQLSIDATVTCPDDVKVKAGDVFECEAKSSDGSTASVTVTQKDDKGNVDWKLGGDGTSTAPSQTTTTP